MKYSKFMVAALALSCVMFSACEPDEPSEDSSVKFSDSGLLVLCEGNWSSNNSTIDLYSFGKKTVAKNIFKTVNGFGIGDTGNDMIVYGAKIYVAVKISNVVSVVSLQNGKELKKIQMTDSAGQGKNPSRLCAANGKVYVACFDGSVVELDTASLTRTGEVPVGRNPDGITLANNRLFVANSGGLSFPNYDRTVSVIALPALTVMATIDIGVNPTTARTLPDGNVLVMVNGDYEQVSPSLVTINSQSNTVSKRENVNVSNFALKGNDVVYSHYDYINDRCSVKIAPYNNIENGSVDFVKQSSIFDGLSTPYALSVSATRQEIYLTDAKHYTSSGQVLCFDYEGNLKYRFSTSQNPSVVLVK